MILENITTSIISHELKNVRVSPLHCKMCSYGIRPLGLKVQHVHDNLKKLTKQCEEMAVLML